jgi:hypothetical protein
VFSVHDGWTRAEAAYVLGCTPRQSRGLPAMLFAHPSVSLIKQTHEQLGTRTMVRARPPYASGIPCFFAFLSARLVARGDGCDADVELRARGLDERKEARCRPR